MLALSQNCKRIFVISGVVVCCFNAGISNMYILNPNTTFTMPFNNTVLGSLLKVVDLMYRIYYKVLVM